MPSEQLAAIKQVRGDTAECRKCGLCCSRLIIEVGLEDALREPLILERAMLLDGNGTLPPEEWSWSLACYRRCVFLNADNTCSIYPTRPDVCVCFAPGGEKCLELREQAEKEKSNGKT